MNVLSGLYQYGSYDGEIFYDGKLCQFKDLKDSEEKGIVIIHQELALSPYLSIKENIFLGNEQAERGVIDWELTEKKTYELLNKVGLSIEPNLLVSQSGVGQQQLVEIAKALSKSVRLLILDEPTAALNEEESANLLRLIRELKEQGVTSIIISHKLIIHANLLSHFVYFIKNRWNFDVLILFYQLKAHSQYFPLFVIIITDNFESTYFGRVFYM